MSTSILLRGACAGLLLLLAACQGTHTVNVNGQKKETGSQAGGAGGFTAVCSIPASPYDFQKEIDAVVDAAKPLGGRAYAYVPAKRVGSSGCTDALHQAQIMAMRKAGLFEKVVWVDNAARDSHPTVPDADWYLWSEGDELVVAYKDGPRMALFNGPGHLDEWVKQVNRVFDSARDWGQSNSNVMQAHLIGPHTYYVINGREFSDAAQASDYLAGRKDALLAHLQPVQPMAPLAHLVLPPPEQQLAGFVQTEQTQHVLSAVMGPNVITFISKPLAGPNDRNTGMEASPVLFAFEKALTDAKLEAVRRSGLFGGLDVTHEDTKTPAFAGPADVVIWQYRNAAQWSVRVGLGQVHVVAWPNFDKAKPEAGADGFIANLRAAVAAAQADTQPEGAALLQPGCKLPEAAKVAKNGATTLSLDLTPDGHVSGSQVAASSGSKDLDEAAVLAFGKCTFKTPAKRIKPADGRIIVSFPWTADQAFNGMPGGVTVNGVTITPHQ